MDEKQLEKLGEELGDRIIEENEDDNMMEEMDEVNDLNPSKD